MYVRSRQEALDVLSDILGLPERTSQIVQITVKIALCLEPDARQFLLDCQSGLIEGGLDHMRKKRQEAVASLQQNEDYDPIVILPSEQDELLEDVGTAMDTLRMVDIVQEIFPQLTEAHSKWEIGRAILSDEAVIRDCLVAAVKHRGNESEIANISKTIESRIDSHNPEWKSADDTIRQLCTSAVGQNPFGDGTPTPADDKDLLYEVVALSDLRAQTLLDLMGSSESDANDYLQEMRSRIQILHEAEQQQAS